MDGRRRLLLLRAALAVLSSVLTGGVCFAQPPEPACPATPLSSPVLLGNAPAEPDACSRWFVNAEYLFWWMKGTPTPVLATTSSQPNAMFVGGLGQPGTQVLLGGSDLGTTWHSGGRLELGYWFTDDHSLGLDLSGFGLGCTGTHYAYASGGPTVITRPFTDNTGTSNALVVAGIQTSTGVLDMGTLDIRYLSTLWGAEANLRSGVVSGGPLRFDVLAGFRTLGLDESLVIDVHSAPTTPSFAGTDRDINDQFRTSNRFYGGQLGAFTQFLAGRWSFDLTSKVALGETQSLTRINGFMNASIINNGMLLTSMSGYSSGGLLTSPTNIGRAVHNQFSVVPEVGVHVGCQLTNWCRAYVGYTFLYWSNVARPGTEIDTTLSGRGLLNPAGTAIANRPAYTFNTTDFWAQGIDFGVALQF